ncbi:hypothetical protein NLM33_10445 [Bradyrhizobium sp. CCGUVB1N3]|uniref:hypothetical protein n=1 Tax=Bradyrhizobium sp. CCGUVB1N3 TaxID=2949629 RepID=UPI0020B2861E|nr:hypothetical protein [Bradyrhizobium sp. CCGUVB1N3]MCP3470738.1 hypothetical protein [Bradyrhizobium sp. CCGUVB1N3]
MAANAGSCPDLIRAAPLLDFINFPQFSAAEAIVSIVAHTDRHQNLTANVPLTLESGDWRSAGTIVGGSREGLDPPDFDWAYMLHIARFAARVAVRQHGGGQSGHEAVALWREQRG